MTAPSHSPSGCAEPCNLRGDCQTNNTCFCTNGYKTCVPNDGTIISASAGCETYVYGDPNNCGECGNVSTYNPDDNTMPHQHQTPRQFLSIWSCKRWHYSQLLRKVDNSIGREASNAQREPWDRRWVLCSYAPTGRQGRDPVSLQSALLCCAAQACLYRPGCHHMMGDLPQHGGAVHHQSGSCEMAT